MYDIAALELIKLERIRQIMVEGYTPSHDDGHTEGQLALLAAAYVVHSLPEYWGLKDCLHHEVADLRWSFKSKDPIRDLVRAGALILAELERRLRKEEKKCQKPRSK